MNTNNWEKKVAVAQVSTALKTYNLSVKKNVISNLRADLVATWDRTGKTYLVLVLPRFSQKEAESESFRSTLNYCKANNARIVVIVWELDQSQSEYTEDREEDNRLPYKIISFKRMESLHKEMLRLETN